MILASQRDLFEIPDDVAYLNCAYMSPLLRAARAAGEAALARKSQPWRITPHDFFADSEAARGLFAELIGADAEGVALIPAASYGLAIAAANLPVRDGQRILVLEDQRLRLARPCRACGRRRRDGAAARGLRLDGGAARTH
jgi:selenocysteine lyase/cysteine desulfurase